MIAYSAASAGSVIGDVEEQVTDPDNGTDVYREFCDQEGLTYTRRERGILDVEDLPGVHLGGDLDRDVLLSPALKRIGFESNGERFLGIHDNQI